MYTFLTFSREIIITKIVKVVCSGTDGDFFKIMCTNLQCRSLISETVEDATAAAQEVIHASVCIVQVGV